MLCESYVGNDALLAVAAPEPTLSSTLRMSPMQPSIGKTAAPLPLELLDLSW